LLTAVQNLKYSTLNVFRGPCYKYVQNDNITSSSHIMDLHIDR